MCQDLTDVLASRDLRRPVEVAESPRQHRIGLAKWQCESRQVLQQTNPPHAWVGGEGQEELILLNRMASSASTFELTPYLWQGNTPPDGGGDP